MYVEKREMAVDIKNISEMGAEREDNTVHNMMSICGAGCVRCVYGTDGRTGLGGYVLDVRYD